LKEAVPATRKVAFLGMRQGWEGASGDVVRDAAGRMGISLVFVLPERGTPSEIERAVETVAQEQPDALLISGEGDLYANRRLIVDLTEKYRLPTMSPIGISAKQARSWPIP
jgi:putative ABC transport system substrate-binding protein